MKLPKWAPIVAYLILVAVLAFTFSKVTQAQDQVKQQSDAVQLAETRGCIRSNVSAALRIAKDPGVASLSPVLDCKATLLTNKTVVLSDTELKKYVAIVVKKRFPIVSDGKVVGSRASLLEGVQALEDVGKK